MGITDLERMVLHDLQNKISNLLGYIEILNSPLVNEHQSAKQEIYSIGEEIRSLTDNVLNFPRLRDGELPLNYQPCLPRELVEQQVKHYQLRADWKHLHLKLRSTETVPETVRCDVRLVSEVVDNLLSNAIQYTQQGTVSVLLDGGPGDGAQQTPWWSFGVSDQAGGMPTSVVRYLTKPAQAMPKEITFQAKGHGYGLVFTKMLVWVLNAQLSVDSNAGVGTTITVRFPQQP